MRRGAGVLLCGGGTGGHVMPGLALAAALRRVGCQDLRWIGDPERLEARLVPAAGLPLLPWGLSRPRVASPWWWLQAIGRAWRCLAELRARPPRAIVSLGGYAALVPGLAAPFLRRPLLVIEQNAKAGKANRLLARWAAAVVTFFPRTASLPPCTERRLGTPLRPIARYSRGHGGPLRVLVMGGSLSARAINQVMIAAAPGLGRIPDLAIVHLAGEEDVQVVTAAYRGHSVQAEVLGFCDEMPQLYDRVDLALCRAGATTVAELCAAGIGAIYVPLPWAADDHQTANAAAVCRAGGAILVRQSRLDGAIVVRLLRVLAAKRDRVAGLGEAAARLAKPEAAGAVARFLACDLRVLRRRRKADHREGGRW